MRRGKIEFSHEAVIDSIIVRDGNKAHTITVKDFVTDFLEGTLKLETDSEDKRVLVDEFFKATALLKDPYDPEAGTDMQSYLDTLDGYKEIKEGHPAFPMKINMEWNEERGATDFEMIGLQEDLVRMLHGVMKSSVMFEQLTELTVRERMQASLDAMRMREAERGEAVSKGELKKV